MSSEPAPNGGGIQVIARAGQILRALASERDGLSLAELSATVKLPKSTVHRIVTALESEGLTASGPGSGRYLLGPEFIRLASGEHEDIRLQARPLLERLSKRVREAVDLSILVGDRVVFVDHIEALHGHPLRAVSAIGASLPAYCTANGRALLAAEDDARLQKLIPARPKAHTPHTITDREAILEAIGRVRVAGYALVVEEQTLGISALGAVVRDHTGAVAAVSVPVPAPRFRNQERELVAALIETCEEISMLLGGQLRSA